MAEIPAEAIGDPLDNTNIEANREAKSSQDAVAIDEETKIQAEQAMEKQYDGQEGKDLTAKADIGKARDYGKARSVLNLTEYASRDHNDSTKQELCEYTNMPIYAKEFPWCVPLSELSELGPGIPLYYYFIKYIMIILAFGFFVAGIACWSSNKSAGNADDWGDDADENFIIQMSIGAHGEGEGKVPGWQAVLHMVVMIFIIITYYIFRRFQINKDDEIDRNEVTASDYTLWVRGLGENFTEEEVKEYFTNNGLPHGQTAEVINVNIPYEISDYVKYVRKHTDLKEKIKYIEDYQNKNGTMPSETVLGCCKQPFPPVEELQKKIAKVDDKINKWINEKSADVGKDLLIGQAFVTFNRQIDVREMDDYLGGDWVKRFWDNVLNKLGRCCICLKKEQVRLQFQKTKELTVEMAPEPNDIFFENLGLSYSKRIKRRIITWLVVLLALGISFGLIYGTSSYQTTTYNDYRDKDEDDRTSSDLNLVRITSIVPAIGVMFVNGALQKTIRRFTSFEQLQTVTEYNAGVALRLTIAQTINTAVIVIAVNYDFEEHWFVPGGLAVDVFYIMLASAFIQPLLYLWDPFYLIKKCKRLRAEKNEYLTQGEANALFEGPPLDMAKRYSNIMKSFILALVYAPLLPAGFLISFVGIWFEYSVDKYVLLRRHARPSRLSSDLSDTMTKLIPWVIFFYSLMLFIFNSTLESDGAPLAFIWMFICLFHLFLPIDTCRRLCSKSDLGSFENENEYKKEAINFFDDYDRANPVTEQQGWQRYNELIKASETGTQLIASGLGSAVQNYISQQQITAQTPGSIKSIGATMLQNVQNVQAYANQRQTMQQTYLRYNTTRRAIDQNRNRVQQIPNFAQRQQAKAMIMQVRNQNHGQNMYQGYTGYGVSAARNPYLYGQYRQIQAPMTQMVNYATHPHPGQFYPAPPQQPASSYNPNPGQVYPAPPQQPASSYNPPPQAYVAPNQYSTQQAVPQQAQIYQHQPGMQPQVPQPGAYPQQYGQPLQPQAPYHQQVNAPSAPPQPGYPQNPGV